MNSIFFLLDFQVILRDLTRISLPILPPLLPSLPRFPSFQADLNTELSHRLCHVILPGV